MARRRVADNSRPARGVRDVAKVFFIMARSRAALILVKFTWQLEFTGHYPREIHLERGYALQWCRMGVDVPGEGNLSPPGTG